MLMQQSLCLYSFQTVVLAVVFAVIVVVVVVVVGVGITLVGCRIDFISHIATFFIFSFSLGFCLCHFL